MRFAQDAFAAWAELEEDAGERVIFPTGGIDLYPASAPDRVQAYVDSLDEVGVGYEWMDAAGARRRWPQWRLDDDVRVMFQEATGIVAAARANAAHRGLAERAGATLLDRAGVTEIRDAGGLYELATEQGAFRAERVILATDAWTNELLGQLWRPINLTVTQEQVHYYESRDVEAFRP